MESDFSRNNETTFKQSKDQPIKNDQHTTIS